MYDRHRQRSRARWWPITACLLVCFMGMGVVASSATSRVSADDLSGMPSLPARCAQVPGGTFPVRQIRDSENVIFADGQEFNVGVLTADLDDAAAKSVLLQLVSGRAVTLLSTHDKDENEQPGTDRYGRLLGNATVPIGSAPVWLQGALIAQGLAVTTFDIGPECGRPELLRIENNARRNKIGHWATGVFSVLDANDAAAVAVRTGSFVIIEGRVRRRSKSRKGVYYNFGRNWREDVTVFVPAKLLKASPSSSQRPPRGDGGTDRSKKSTAANPAIDLGLRINNRLRLRTRGWVKDRGGPLIVIRHLDQIEWLP